MNINNILSSFSLVSVFIYLTIGFYTFKQNPKSLIHKFFLAVCSSYAIWAFAYSFAYIAQDKYLFSFWNKVSALGWCSFSALILYLVLLITDNKIYRKRIIKIVIFFPAFFFYFLAVFLFGVDIDTPPIIQMTFYIGDFIYNLSYLLFSILLILVWGLKTNNKRIKKQSRILVITSIIPFGLNLLTQTIFPLVTNIELPKIGQIYSIITITGIYIVVTKYKFLKLPKNFIFEEVMNEMLDMVIIVNDQGEIIKISKNTLNILGYSEHELLEEKLDFIIDKNDRKRISLEKIKERNFNIKNLKMLRKNGHILPVNLSCKQIMDSKLHEFLGAIIIFQDMSLVYELKRVNTEIFNEKERFKITLLSVADGVISTDIKGNIQFINKVGEQLTGWTYEEAVNKPIEDVFNIINQ